MVHGAVFMLEWFIDQCQCAKNHSSDHVWGTNMSINVTSFTSVVHVLHLLQCVVIYHDIDLRHYGFSKTFSFTIPFRWVSEFCCIRRKHYSQTSRSCLRDWYELVDVLWLMVCEAHDASSCEGKTRRHLGNSVQRGVGVESCGGFVVSTAP